MTEEQKSYERERQLCQEVVRTIDNLVWQLNEGGDACKDDIFYSLLLVQCRFFRPLVGEGAKRPDPGKLKPGPDAASKTREERTREWIDQIKKFIRSTCPNAFYDDLVSRMIQALENIEPRPPDGADEHG